MSARVRSVLSPVERVIYAVAWERAWADRGTPPDDARMLGDVSNAKLAEWERDVAGRAVEMAWAAVEAFRVADVSGLAEETRSMHWRARRRTTR